MGASTGASSTAGALAVSAGAAFFFPARVTSATRPGRPRCAGRARIGERSGHRDRAPARAGAARATPLTTVMDAMCSDNRGWTRERAPETRNARGALRARRRVAAPRRSRRLYPKRRLGEIVGASSSPPRFLTISSSALPPPGPCSIRYTRSVERPVPFARHSFASVPDAHPTRWRRDGDARFDQQQRSRGDADSARVSRRAEADRGGAGGPQRHPVRDGGGGRGPDQSPGERHEQGQPNARGLHLHRRVQAQGWRRGRGDDARAHPQVPDQAGPPDAHLRKRAESHRGARRGRARGDGGRARHPPGGDGFVHERTQRRGRARSGEWTVHRRRRPARPTGARAGRRRPDPARRCYPPRIAAGPERAI